MCQPIPNAAGQPPPQANRPQTWGRFLRGRSGLIEPAFIKRWRREPWQPIDEDTKAAAKLHMQLASRITTQPLGYLDGVEKTALNSVYAIFELTRKICDAHPLARHFEMIAWHVLNTQVRPFTAKWHRESERGGLHGLDTTDDFRAELTALQQKLAGFLDLLLELRDGKKPPASPPGSGRAREDSIQTEMENSLPWGIPPKRGGVTKEEANKLNAQERKAIEARRLNYQHIPNIHVEKVHATALALSGGGIRSATFSLGVLVALAKRGLLPQFDYLSTVSGGGYLGSFLTTYLNSPSAAVGTPAIGLRKNELPFRRDDGEAEALRHIRHHSKYLATGGLGERLQMAVAQLYGMLLNGLGVIFVAAVFVVVEYNARTGHWVGGAWSILTGWTASLDLPAWATAMPHTPIYFFGSLLAVWAIVSLFLIRHGRPRQRIADTGLMMLAAVVAGSLVWIGLGKLHRLMIDPIVLPEVPKKQLLAALGAIPVFASAFATIAGKMFGRAKKVLGVLSVFAAPLFFFGLYLALYYWAGLSATVFDFGGHAFTRFELVTAALAVVGFTLLNINFTSPHRHYRNKLAEAYLIQPAKTPKPDRPFDDGVSLKLSTLGSASERAPYHLINAALNVPASKNPAMQGRLTDFFLFSKAFCGSPLTGYETTAKWEAKDSHLDVGTAMAISGAAAAPQMGLGTKRRMSFWLALLNIRLGYWVRNPFKGPGFSGGAPGLCYLLKEMRGSMDERAPWLFLSDGGHIENLGVYELLRRRCKFIVAVDGEQDERMTFAGLTTLQRLAKIDMEVTIDIDLDDLRLDDKGLSRSHFRFCRVIYSEDQTGYLLYIKLSLTGNEGEFLRRYRLDEPAFPHHSTADQFFSEAQFEAYRSLGEHVVDKLFLRALVGDDLAGSKPVEIEKWFCELGKRLLDPPRS